MEPTSVVLFAIPHVHQFADGISNGLAAHLPHEVGTALGAALARARLGQVHPAAAVGHLARDLLDAGDLFGRLESG